MFAPLPQLHHHHLPPSSHYIPARSSPLAPRTMVPQSPQRQQQVSAASGTCGFSLFTAQDGSTTASSRGQLEPPSSSRSRTSPTYAQRYATQVSNPLGNPSRSYRTSAAPSARATRRDLFLNRIKQDRDAGRFETRGEQLMQMEHMTELKQWGESMRRHADGLMRDIDLDEEIRDDEIVSDDADIDALNEYISQEQAVEMALVENMAQEQNPLGASRNNNSLPRDSFSDGEYDDIFMDLADSIPDNSQGMDMSCD